MDTSPKLTQAQVKYIQQVTGKFLFDARAIDNTMMHAINDIASSGNVESIYAVTIYFLNYAASYPDAKVIYQASDMILIVDSDATYSVHPKAQSRVGRYLYLENKEQTQFNGPALVLAKIIKNVMTSAAKAEVGALYMNAQEVLAVRQCLIELGHPQPATLWKQITVQSRRALRIF